MLIEAARSLLAHIGVLLLVKSESVGIYNNTGALNWGRSRLAG